MEPVLTVAFVIACVAFFKTQFGWAQKHALLAAFLVAIVIGVAPQISEVLPALAPWVDAVLNVVKIFLAAAGSYDFVVGLMVKREDLRG